MLSALKRAADAIVGKATTAIDKLSGVTRSEAERAMEAAALVAMADGELQPEEKAQIEKLIEIRPELQTLNAYELVGIFSRTVAQAQVSFRLTKKDVLDKLRAVTSDISRDRILLLAISIAEASGDIGADEEKVLGEIAQALSRRLSDYL